MPDFIASRPTFSSATAQNLAQEYYGVSATATELPSERDQNFHLRTAEGQAYVLKIANANEEETVLDFQNQVLQYLHQHGQKDLYPQVCPSNTGQVLLKAADQAYFLRLLTYLPGQPLALLKPHLPELFHQLGQFLARTDKVLADFSHSAMYRHLHWDLKHASQVISKHLAQITSPTKQVLVKGFLKTFEQESQPLLNQLRHSLIHADANDYNILISTEDELGQYRIGGLIDFGDMVHTYTIAELAIACAYAMLNKPDPLMTVQPLIAGYHQYYPLTELEVQVLYPLICMRLCTSVVLSAYQQSQAPDDAYLSVSAGPAWDLLEKLQKLPPQLAHYSFRSACGWSPCPQTSSLKQVLTDNTFSPVVMVDWEAEGCLVFDLSVSSLDLGSDIAVDDVATFSQHLTNLLQSANAKVGIGRYDEARLVYSSDFFKAAGDDGYGYAEARTIHLGLDIFMPPETPIHAPLAGKVHSFANNAQALDYGPTIILEHGLAGLSFYTLYGHLSLDSLTGLTPGMMIEAGQAIAKIGPAEVNGGWPPHLHFQLITDMLGREGEFPGVAAPSQRTLWQSLSPDPNVILNIPRKYFPAPKPSKTETMQKRAEKIGPSLSISYKKPLKIVRGAKQFLYDDTGRAYLDLVNNVCHVGHSHPQVVQAAYQQMALLNTNTRYLNDLLGQYADRLIATLPDPLKVCFFVCSGSEANELALRLARAHTGAQDVLVVDAAYHGNTSALVDISPYKYEGRGGFVQKPYVHKVLMPDDYRGPYKRPQPQVGEKYARHLEQTLSQAQDKGRHIGAFFCESLLGCGGQIVLPKNYLKQAYGFVRQAGGVCIADEVQVGFGRVGRKFWGFELQGVVPDIVTMGKPMGNGHPLAAVVTTPKIAASFNNGMEYFNTFGGNPVSCAVGLAVLNIIEDESLQSNALRVGAYLKAGLNSLKQKYALIGDVRGEGLFIGAELVLDHVHLKPAPTQATYIVERMKEHGILLSTDGPLHNVIKIKPPLVVNTGNVDFMLQTLDKVLDETAL